MKPFFFLALLGVSSQLLADDVGLRLRFGLNDKQPTDWSGTVEVSPGRVALISGWRFTPADEVDGVGGWKTMTRRVAAQRRSNNPQRAGQPAAARRNATMSDNGVLITLTDVRESSKVTIKTAQGTFTFALKEVTFGNILEQLDGAVEIEQTAAAFEATAGDADDDYPSAAVAADGSVWVAYVGYTPGIERSERARSFTGEPADLSYLVKPAGGDQLWLRRIQGHETGAPVAVTPPGRDIYKSAVAVDGRGKVWVFWSENSQYAAFPKAGTANFEIWARPFANGQGGDPVNLSQAEENDVWPVAATDARGKVWVAWQGARDRVFRILTRHQDGDGWGKPTVVSEQTRNCWAPTICAGTSSAGGRVAIAWDTYEKGDYDVWVREFSAKGEPRAARSVAASEDYEARPAMTYDRSGALWIAWEQSGPTWGKDWGALDQASLPLYRDRQIGLAVLRDDQWLAPVGDLIAALPNVVPRRRQQNQRVPAVEPEGESRQAGREALARRNLPHNNIARIACDSNGRVWLLARSRQNDLRTPLGSLWLNWAAYYDGTDWVGPILVPHSDNLLYNVPALAAVPEGGLALVHSSDHRQDRNVRRSGQAGNAALGADLDPFQNDLYLSFLRVPAAPPASKLVPVAKISPLPASPSPATLAERAEIERCRNYRLDLNGQSLRILRGEFHRHTEISGDGGNDGPLEDMWRYAIDVAGMDWLGCGDHDNGAGREYPWWLTQKTTDAFHLPGAFNSLFTYERSVRYPEGHRNVIFARRGVRTLPRLPKMEPESEGHAPDTQMLYRYLKMFDGICASHTSATDMGTDWRDNDPTVEPMVEIYQGCRQNYERPGAPRCPTEADAIGGWRPKGFVNLALQKGYRLAFESSSDHNSTHISYALVYAEDASRAAIVAAMKQRHVYAATDNIIADFRCRADGAEHMLGDEFVSGQPPQLRLHLRGTAPFSRIVLVKDDVEVHTLTPDQEVVDLTWTDPKPEAGRTSYYYARGEQANGELVWVSPMWITYRPNP